MTFDTTDETLKRYLEDIRKTSPIDRKDEHRLFQLCREGNRAAREKLVSANMRFVLKVALQYRGCPIPLPDLVSEGAMGLIRAIESFDHSRGLKFISYAVWWIRQSIQKALFEQVGAVRIPPNKLALVNRFKRALLQNGGNYEKTVSLPEFEAHEREIAEIMEKIADMSLNAPIGGEGDGRDPVTTLLDVLGTDGGQEADAEKAELSRSLDAVLGQMSEREEKVLRMYYGINYAREFTLDEIGRELKLTRERVRQIKNRSLRKLLRSRESKEKLLPFVSGKD